jgi:hypothetical protein
MYNWNNQNNFQYFTDEWTGPSWNGGSYQPNQNVSVNPNNVMPAFFV